MGIPNDSGPQRRATPKDRLDDWRSLTIGIDMTQVGCSAMVGLPVISTAWVTRPGFSEVRVGRVAGADLDAERTYAWRAYYLTPGLKSAWVSLGHPLPGDE